MDTNLKNKVAIITGASSGIGEATAMLFAQKGARVVVVCRHPERGSETIARIKANKGEATLIPGDVSKESEVRRLVKATVDQYGQLDILVNNAGIYKAGDALKISTADWETLLATNLTGVFLCMKYCIPEMVKNGGGVIVNVSSEAGLVGIKSQVAYNVSKSGVIALSKSTAVDFAGDNIRVNCICPGRVLTPLVEEVINRSESPETTRRNLSEDRPLMRMGKPAEIAAGILFLASDAAPYTLGAVLSIDGGYTVP